jgi:FAD:protein FMN transferase
LPIQANQLHCKSASRQFRHQYLIKAFNHSAVTHNRDFHLSSGKTNFNPSARVYGQAAHNMHYEEFRAMNSDILLAASGEDLAVIKNGFELARQAIERSEQRFTRFTEISELAELNRSSGKWFTASGDMFQVIEQAYRLASETGGLFNPAILPELKQAGYDRSMDAIRSENPRNDPEKNIERQDFRQIQLNSKTQSVYLPGGMQVDLGGIAKGWIAEQAARQLADYCVACAVSAGGDMFLINLPEGETRWEIGLEDPLKPEQDLAVLHVLPGAIATSSIAKRQWKHNGKIQHHLIDPRTGKPAITDWLSTTVWAEQATQAEVYAKVLLITGSDAADDLLTNQTSMAYLAVDKHGWVHGSSNYHEVFNV